MSDDIFDDDIENMTEKEIEEMESRLQGIMNRAENTVVAFAKKDKYSFKDALFYVSCIVAITSLETGHLLDSKMGGGVKFTADIAKEYIMLTADELMKNLIECEDSDDE